MIVSWHRNYRWGDDDWFLEMVRNESLYRFLTRRYLEWSSRTGIEAAIALTIEYLWLWRLLNGLALASMVWGVANYLPPIRGRYVVLLWCTGFFLIDPQVLFWSVWWVTGSYNYLWPAAAAMFALLPFVRPALSARFFLFTLPAAFFASFNEQLVLLMLGFQCIFGFDLWRNRRLLVWHVIQVGLCLLVLLFMLASPGVKVRYLAELRWMPGFESLHIGTKLVQGLDHFLNHAFVVGNSLTGIWLVMLAWLVHKQQVNGAARRLVTAVLLAYVMTLAAPWVRTIWPDASAGNVWARWLTDTSAYMPNALAFFSYSLLNPQNLYGAAYWGRLFFLGSIWLGAVWLTYMSLRTVSCRRALVAVAGMFAAALASTVVGLSPTLYSSGVRLFLFGDLLLLLVCSMLYQVLPVGETWPRWFFCVAGALAFHGVRLSFTLQ